MRLLAFVAATVGPCLLPVSACAQSVVHTRVDVDDGTHWYKTLPSSHRLPDGAPALAVHVTEQAQSSDSVHVVIFLHGWQGCPRVLLASGPTSCVEGGPVHRPFALRDAVEAAAKEMELPIVFVVPQLSFWKRTGAPGRFRDENYVKAWLRSLRSVEALRDKKVLSTTLVAHSAGFETALAIVNAAPDAVAHVAMLDALYDGAPAFAQWIMGAPDRRALSLTLGRGKTWKHSSHTERIIRRKLGAGAIGRRSLEQWEAGVRFKRAQASAKHRDIPREQLAEVLELLLGASSRRR